MNQKILDMPGNSTADPDFHKPPLEQGNDRAPFPSVEDRPSIEPSKLGIYPFKNLRNR